MVTSGGSKRRAARIVAPALALLGALTGAAVLAGGSAASDGTINLTAGTLTMTGPSTLSWPDTALTGLDQTIVDATTADQSYVVNDASGSAAGWKVTASATQFTSGTNKLPATAFTTNGSTTSATATDAPSAACSTGVTCTVATESGTAYPVTIGSTAATVFSAAAGSGLGSNAIGNVGWWLAVPGNARAGTYTSTVTLAVVSGP